MQGTFGTIQGTFGTIQGTFNTTWDRFRKVRKKEKTGWGESKLAILHLIYTMLQGGEKGIINLKKKRKACSEISLTFVSFDNY
jgi:hypothetical protein